MNNISFGNESIGYYETVAGGAGAGPGWKGRSGVHSHMTNTRITDPEILEKRSDMSSNFSDRKLYFLCPVMMILELILLIDPTSRVGKKHPVEVATGS